MSEVKSSTRRQLELMLELQQLADRRAASETTVQAEFDSESSSAQQDYDSASKKLHQHHAHNRRQLENEFAQVKITAAEQYDEQVSASKQRHDRAYAQMEARYNSVTTDAEKKLQESSWQAQAVFDAAKDQPQQQLQEATHRIQSRRRQTDGLERDAHTLMEMRRLGTEISDCGIPHLKSEISNPKSAEDRLQEAINQLHQGVLDLQAERLPSLLLEGGRRLVGHCSVACWQRFLPAGLG